MIEEPYIPEYITVHLGAPGTESGNEVIAFPDYLKITAACEIHPKWPESAIRTILYLQISHVLYRFSSNWYRQMGYDFDITCSPICDLSYVKGHITFQNINCIVDEIFNSCICKNGSNEPFSFQQCEDSVKPPSRWTIVALAESGMTSSEILQNTLGDDFGIISGLRVQNQTFAYPDTDLHPGDQGKNVRALQIQLNRVSRYYPAIPKINPADGILGEQTQNALSVFREHFGLPQSDTVDSTVLNRLAFLYRAAKRLSGLHTSDISVRELPHGYPGLLRIGDSGMGVRVVQVYLTAVGIFYPYCLLLKQTDIFNKPMENAVIAFQKASELEPDGIIGELTWQALENAYYGILRCCPLEGGFLPCPPHSLKQGFFGDDVRHVQQYLSAVSSTYSNISKLTVTGLFGAKMVGSVRAFQREFEIPVTGAVNEQTWNALGSLYSDLTTGYDKQPEQYPGFTLS